MAAPPRKKNGRDENVPLPRYHHRAKDDGKWGNPPGGGSKSPVVFDKKSRHHGHRAIRPGMSKVADGDRMPRPVAVPPLRAAQLPRTVRKLAPTNHAGNLVNKQPLLPTASKTPERKDAVGIPAKQPVGGGKQPDAKGPAGDLRRGPRAAGLREEQAAVRDVGVLAKLSTSPRDRRERLHHHHHGQWCPGCADHKPGPGALAIGHLQAPSRDDRPPGRLIMLYEPSKRHRHHHRHRDHEDSSEKSTTELKTTESSSELTPFHPDIKTPFYKKLKLPSGRRVDVIHRNLYLRKWYKKRVRCEKSPFIFIFLTAIFISITLYLYLYHQEVLFKIVSIFRPKSESVVTAVLGVEADSGDDNSETALKMEITATSSMDNDTVTVPWDLQ